MNITHEQYRKDIQALEGKLAASGVEFDKVYGIPRGGAYPASMVAQDMGKTQVFDPAGIDAKTLVVDDLLDSGKTMRAAMENAVGAKYAAVYAKESAPDVEGCVVGTVVPSEWLVFPDESGSGIEENAKRILQYIGEDVNREGLLETPKRMRRAWDEVFAGYKTDPHDLVKTFVQGACKEMVILKHCEYFSYCEHHFFPFFGHCSIGYVPRNKVIGVSKLARLLDCYSRRLQIQERMTTQIADFLEKELDALGVYVVCEGQHFCMTSRGVRKQDATMVTSAIRGQFMENAAMRAEFLSLIRQ